MNDQTNLADLSAAADEGRSKIFERALDVFDRARLQTGINTSHNPTHGGYPTPPQLSDESLGIMRMRDGKVLPIHDHGFIADPENPIPGSEWNAKPIPETMPDPVDPDGINTVVSAEIRMEQQRKIAAEIVAAGGPRAQGFQYGSGWIGPKPDAYFDGVRLNTLLSSRSNAASTVQWRLETALRNLRLAETETERAITVITLEETMRNILADDPTIAIDGMVEDIIKTVDNVAPFEPKGYVPNMNLAHAVHPIHKAVRRLRDYLASIKG